MLEQTASNSSALTLSEPQASSETDALQAAFRFLRTLQFRKGIIICTMVVSALLGTFYYLTATRYYQSDAELLVLQTGGSVMESSHQGDKIMKDLLPTYQKIMQSDAVLTATIKQLPTEHRVDFKGLPSNKWVGQLRKNLSIRMPRQTNVLELSYRSKDPESAAVVLQALLTSSIDFLNKTHQGASQEILNILTKEKVEVEQKLAEKEAELLQLRSRSSTMISDGEKGTNVIVTRVVRLNEELVNAQEETLRAEAMLQTIEAAIRNGEDILHHSLNSVDAVGKEIILSELGIDRQDVYSLARINEQLLEDRARLQTAREVYGPSHPVMRELQEGIRLKEQWLQMRPILQGQRMQQLRHEQFEPRLVQMAQQRLQHARQHEQSVREKFEEEKQHALNLNQELATFEILNLDIKRLRSFYDVLLERAKDIDLGKDKGIQTSIVSEPMVQPAPVTPKLTLVAALSVVLGLGSGMALVYVLDVLDDRFRSPEELRIQLRTPVLTMIPQLEPIDGHGIECVYTFAQPNGVESEAFRTLRTALEFSGDSTQRIVVSSTEPSDGKTTVLSNLSVAFAQAGKRTLLIDADMRRPGMTALFEMRGSTGLSSILRSDESIPDSALENLVQTRASGLDFIPSGPRPVNPLELLASHRFSELLSWAETEYDQIIVDAPPVLAVSDAALIGRLVDGVVMVVRPDKNQRRLVVRAADTLRTFGCNLLGIVANHLTPESGDGYGYGYGYGYKYEYGADFDDSIQDQQPSDDREAADWTQVDDDDDDYRHRMESRSAA